MRARPGDRGDRRAGRSRAPRYVHILSREADLRGRDEEVARAVAWLRAGEPGVMALVGIGGTGKTVLLQQVLDAAEEIDGLFVWSFYRDPDVDRFLNEAHRYVAGRDSPAEGSLGHVYALVEALKASGPMVLVLDGLERIQSFAEDAPGRIEDPALRVLLERLAAGVGKTAALVTTRIGVRDLADRAGYVEVPLDVLPPRAGAALLADRGVTGDTAARERLSAVLGGHPLTLSLFGSLLAEAAKGDPARANELVPLASLDGLTPSARLAEVLKAYDGRLPRVEAAMLERIAVFRGDVTADLVVKVLLEPAQAGGLVSRFRTWWSDPLGRLDAAGLLHAIEHLEALRILHREGERDGKVVYAFHAAVKDHFYERLLAGGDSAKVHESVRVHLAAKPLRRKPETEEELDRMEELIFHTLRCGRAEEAFRIYWDRVEGYEHLGRGLGAYTRGRRMVDAFFEGGDPAKPVAGLPAWQAAMLAGDLGLYLEKLGDLDGALACHLGTHAAARDAKDTANMAVGLLNQASILVLQGQLPDARRLAAKAQHHAEQAGDDGLRADALTLGGLAEGLSGKAAHALASFAEARRLVCALDGADHELTRRRGARHAQVLLRAGDARTALRLLDANVAECRRRGWRQDVALCEVLRAQALLATGDVPGARRAWESAREFSFATGMPEVLALGHLAGARILRATKDVDRATEEVEEGLRLARRVGLAIATVDLLVLAGELLADAGDPRAATLAEEALKIASEPSRAYAAGQADARALAARVRKAGA